MTRRMVFLSVAGLALSVGAVGAHPDYQAGPVANPGRISGTVTFEGVVPADPPSPVTMDGAHCGSSVPARRYVVHDGKLANVVVYLEGIDHGRPLPERPAITLANRGCIFEPLVSATTAGAQLTVANEDDVLHNTHGYEGRRTAFNVGIPAGKSVTVPVRRPGVVRVGCDVHPWMRAWIHVFPHPYFAVTGADGAFSIPDLPAGRYTLKAWHEELGTLTQQVEVGADGAVTAGFAFNARNGAGQ